MEYKDVHEDLDKTCRSIKSQPHIVELKEESEGNSKSAKHLIKLMLYPNSEWQYSGSCGVGSHLRKKPYFCHKSNHIA